MPPAKAPARSPRPPPVGRDDPGAHGSCRGAGAIPALAMSAPAFGIAFPGNAAVREGADHSAHLKLLVRFDRRLLRSAVLLTPDHAQFGADRNIRIDGSEAERLLFVVRIAGEHRQADRLAAGVD